MAQRAPAARRPGRIVARLLVPLLLLAVGAAIYLIVSSRLNSGNTAAQVQHPAAHRRPPPYWTVKAGDTFAHISEATGVPVALLQAYNPNIDPFALQPGERLNLWRSYPHPHRPKAPPGPTFWTVKPGQSFGSIAAATKIDITTLEQLNPHIKPSAIQPGDRVRLRH
jgi:LysM repeat protein